MWKSQLHFSNHSFFKNETEWKGNKWKAKTKSIQKIVAYKMLCFILTYTSKLYKMPNRHHSINIFRYFLLLWFVCNVHRIIQYGTMLYCDHDCVTVSTSRAFVSSLIVFFLFFFFIPFISSSFAQLPIFHNTLNNTLCCVMCVSEYILLNNIQVNLNVKSCVYCTAYCIYVTICLVSLV